MVARYGLVMVVIWVLARFHGGDRVIGHGVA